MVLDQHIHRVATHRRVAAHHSGRLNTCKSLVTGNLTLHAGPDELQGYLEASMAKLQAIGDKLVTNGLTLPLLHAGPDELQGYLEALMAKLLEVVRTGNSETQYSALGAIASAANAAGTSFQPYVPAVYPVLQQYMEVQSSQTAAVVDQRILTRLLPVVGQRINHMCLLFSLFCSNAQIV